MKTKQKTIFLVGGGTGGHVLPVFALAEGLKEQKHLNIFTIGNNSKIEKQVFGHDANHLTIVAGKLHRQITIQNFAELFKFIAGLVQSKILLLRYRPNLIFIKGGFVSVPFVFWARLFHIPYFVHESDIEMGAANRFGISGAKKVYLGFPLDCYKKIPTDKAEYVGQILRPNLLAEQDQKPFFADKKPIIFVTGGSQGAHNINSNIFAILKELLPNYNVLHQTGQLDYAAALGIRKDLKHGAESSYKPIEFLSENEMIAAFHQADIVVARAGATTLAEIARLQKPMIIIPYKYAALDHQTKNAKLLTKAKAAVVISDDALSGKILLENITKLMFNEKAAREMGERASRIFPTRALETIVSDILNFVKQR